MEKLLYVVLILLNLVCHSNLQTTNDACKVTFAKSGKSYDISQAYSTTDFISPKDGSGNIYYVAPCHNTKFTCSPSASPVCQVDGVNKPHSCGTLASSLNNAGAWVEATTVGQGFTVHYTGGDNGRNAELTYTCATNTIPVFSGTPFEQPTLDYHLTLKTTYACASGTPTPPGPPTPTSPPGPPTPTPPKTGGGFDYGWIFVIIVLAGLALYFVVGAVVKKFVFHAEGLEIIPQNEFWLDLPFLIKDGFMFFCLQNQNCSWLWWLHSSLIFFSKLLLLIKRIVIL